jgi:hypothetical protein
VSFGKILLVLGHVNLVIVDGKAEQSESLTDSVLPARRIDYWPPFLWFPNLCITFLEFGRVLFWS